MSMTCTFLLLFTLPAAKFLPQLCYHCDLPSSCSLMKHFTVLHFTAPFVNWHNWQCTYTYLEFLTLTCHLIRSWGYSRLFLLVFHGGGFLWAFGPLARCCVIHGPLWQALFYLLHNSSPLYAFHCYPSVDVCTRPAWRWRRQQQRSIWQHRCGGCSSDWWRGRLCWCWTSSIGIFTPTGRLVLGGDSATCTRVLFGQLLTWTWTFSVVVAPEFIQMNSWISAYWFTATCVMGGWGI